MVNQLKIGHWIETDAILSAPIGELSEFSEIKRDGAVELIILKGPESAIKSE